MVHLSFLVVLCTCLLPSCWGDFHYTSFNKTIGITFVGDAFPSSCEKDSSLAVGDKHAFVQRETSDRLEQAAFEASSKDDADSDTVFGHRDAFHGTFDNMPLGQTCSSRVRLTPSAPSKSGAVWHTEPVPVSGGFETGFRFQVTDLSRSCTVVRDSSFGTKKYQSCKVHGGDGFSFVLHRHANATETLGHNGAGMGSQGIGNAVLVDFDTWYNPDSDDLIQDHVVVRVQHDDAGEDGARLHVPRVASIADGRVHDVMMRYYPFVNDDYFDWFILEAAAKRYMVDYGEAQPLGTIVLWVDDMSTPVVAFPINLAAMLTLQDNEAYVGFTSSTGVAFEKHDILSWYFCEDIDSCHGQYDGVADYHEETKLNYP